MSLTTSTCFPIQPSSCDYWEETFLEQDTPTEYENSVSGFPSRWQSCWGLRLPNPSVFKIQRISILAPLRFAASLSSLVRWHSRKCCALLKAPPCLAVGKDNHMARPKKKDTPVKTRTFVVRLDDIQYSVIEKYAAQLGMSMADYIRHQAIHGKVDLHYPIVVDLPQLQKFTDELSAIGNNLNQIARYFNMGGLQSKAMRERINSCIEELMDMRKKVLEMAGDFDGSTETFIQ